MENLFIHYVHTKDDHPLKPSIELRQQSVLQPTISNLKGIRKNKRWGSWLRTGNPGCQAPVDLGFDPTDG